MARLTCSQIEPSHPRLPAPGVAFVAGFVCRGNIECEWRDCESRGCGLRTSRPPGWLEPVNTAESPCVCCMQYGLALPAAGLRDGIACPVGLALSLPVRRTTEMCGLRSRPRAHADPQNYYYCIFGSADRRLTWILFLPPSLRYNGHFPGEPGLALQALLHCALAAAHCIVIGPVSLCVCGGEVCYHDNSKLRASILTKLGL